MWREIRAIFYRAALSKNSIVGNGASKEIVKSVKQDSELADYVSSEHGNEDLRDKTHIEMRQKALKRMCALFYQIGVPKNLKGVVGERAAKKIIEEFVNQSPQLAYKMLAEYGDEDFLQIARKSLIANCYPLALYDYAESYEDVVLLLDAAWEGLETFTWQAYETGRKLKCEKLICAARKKMIEQDPRAAYSAGKRVRDKELIINAAWAVLDRHPEGAEEIYFDKTMKDEDILEEARRKFAKKEPVKAFNLGRDIRDKELNAIALDEIIKRTISEIQKS